MKLRQPSAEILGLIVVWIGLIQSSVFASSCARRNPKDYFQFSDAVFAGKVIAEEQRAWQAGRIKFKWGPPFIYFTESIDKTFTIFEVTTVWKGKILARTQVGAIGSYAYPFRRGEEYIVYATSFEGNLLTPDCINKRLIDANEDLAVLGSGRPPAPNPSLAANYIRTMAIVFLLLFILGWAAWQAQRKYGVQNS